MSEFEPFLHPLDAGLDEDSPGIGGKARNILKLAKIPGIRIPRSWVLTAGAFRRFAHANFSPEQLAGMVACYLEGDRMPLFAELAHAPVPKRMESELVKHLPKNDLVIVRSSGTCEDSAATSLAGHYESIITRTTRKDLLFTIKTCWLVGLRVYLDQIYHPDWNLSFGEIIEQALTSIGLVIQEVIDAEKSGIYFSQSPMHPNRAFAVANRGTCHSCVDGRMASDFYIIREDGQVESFSNRYKFEMTTFNRHGNRLLPGETVKTPLGKTTVHFPYGEFLYSAKVPAPYDDHCVLWGDDFTVLHDAASRIREAVGYEIDMEWSFANGEFIALQVRPITTKPPEAVITSEDSRFMVASTGVATGPVKIVLCAADLYKVEEGDIIAVIATDPDFMPILYRCGGIVSEEGSPLCHTAIVARELKIPCILGVADATRGAFMEGETVTVDASRGRIVRPEKEEAPAESGEAGETPGKFQRNEIVFDLDHLGILETGRTPTIAASAILHGYAMATCWGDPTPARLREYLEFIKLRGGFREIFIHWDITDHLNVPLEADPNLNAFRKLVNKDYVQFRSEGCDIV